MNYSHEVERMCPIAKGPHHGPAPIPEEGRWVKAYQISDISGLSHGIGWCAPQQGCCKLTLNVKDGIIQEALVETLGCSGMTHSAAMAGEILPGKLFWKHSTLTLYVMQSTLQCVKSSNSWHTEELRLLSPKTVCRSALALKTLVKVFVPRLVPFSTGAKGVRYLELAEGYILSVALDENNEAIGYKFVRVGKMLEAIRHGMDPKEAYEKNIGTYGRYENAPKYIDPREE